MSRKRVYSDFVAGAGECIDLTADDQDSESTYSEHSSDTGFIDDTQYNDDDVPNLYQEYDLDDDPIEDCSDDELARPTRRGTVQESTDREAFKFIDGRNPTPREFRKALVDGSIMPIEVANPAVDPRPIRIRAKKFFLTFPQVDKDCTTVQCRDRILSRFSGTNIKFLVVALEKHKDGCPHIHIALWLNIEVSYRSHDYWDFVCESHGHYKVMKFPVKCVEYIIKEDNYVCFPEDFDPQAYIKSRQVHKSVESLIVANKVLEGFGLDTIIHEHPGWCIANGRKLTYFQQLVQDVSINATCPWFGVEVGTDTIPNISSSLDKVLHEHQLNVICKWINDNVCRPRQFKQEQLLISGPPNIGKTSLVMMLEKFLRVYHVPVFEDFYDGYLDGRFDLIVFDEFKGQKSIQWMNYFLQGNPMQLKKKGSQYLKRQNLPVIILSNFDIEVCYRKVFQNSAVALEALQSRLRQVRLSFFIDIVPRTSPLEHLEIEQ